MFWRGVFWFSCFATSVVWVFIKYIFYCSSCWSRSSVIINNSQNNVAEFSERVLFSFYYNVQAKIMLIDYIKRSWQLRDCSELRWCSSHLLWANQFDDLLINIIILISIICVTSYITYNDAVSERLFSSYKRALSVVYLHYWLQRYQEILSVVVKIVIRCLNIDVPRDWTVYF